MTKSRDYIPRFYRELMGNKRWKSFRSAYLETDLWIAVSADKYEKPAEIYSLERINFYRGILDEHIRTCPEFLSSLVPLPAPAGIHAILKEMYKASALAGTGPMSAVAGAVAEHICNDLASEYDFSEVVVENGGDIFTRLVKPATISVYAGNSPLSDKIGLVVEPEITPISVCCSSGTVGHSLSFGTADAAVIVCRSGAVADAFATACCNAVGKDTSIMDVTESMIQIPEILSVIIIRDDKVGIGGGMEVTVL